MKPASIIRSSFASAWLVAAAVALSGCATAWRVDSDVQTFSSLPATAVTSPAAPGSSAPFAATFRFERLPLQQATPAQQADQARLEAMALPALTQVGLVQDEASARYNVQVSAQLQQVVHDYWGSPFGGPPGYWWPRTSVYYGRGGGGAWWPYYGGGFGPGFATASMAAGRNAASDAR